MADSKQTVRPDDGSADNTAGMEPVMRRFRVVSALGMGSFGVVHRASVWGTIQSCALKTISKDGRTAHEVDLLKREIKISRELYHHTGVVLTAWAFETHNSLIVVQERALGDLYRVLKDDERLPEHRVRDIARQLVSALEYIHSKRVIHRDLKPQNILVLSGGRVALCDFGFARSVSAQTALLTTIKGTPLYMAPEVVQEQPYNHNADIWSLGVILYEMYAGKPPFWGESLVALMKRVVRRPFAMPEGISNDFVCFLNDTLEKDPTRRISWPALANHPFIKGVEELFVPQSAIEGRSRLAGLFNPRRIPPSPSLNESTPPLPLSAASTMNSKSETQDGGEDNIGLDSAKMLPNSPARPSPRSLEVHQRIMNKLGGGGGVGASARSLHSPEEVAVSPGKPISKAHPRIKRKLSMDEALVTKRSDSSSQLGNEKSTTSTKAATSTKKSVMMVRRIRSKEDLDVDESQGSDSRLVRRDTMSSVSTANNNQNPSERSLDDNASETATPQQPDSAAALLAPLPPLRPHRSISVQERIHELAADDEEEINPMPPPPLPLGKVPRSSSALSGLWAGAEEDKLYQKQLNELRPVGQSPAITMLEPSIRTPPISLSESPLELGRDEMKDGVNTAEGVAELLRRMFDEEETIPEEQVIKMVRGSGSLTLLFLQSFLDRLEAIRTKEKPNSVLYGLRILRRLLRFQGGGREIPQDTARVLITCLIADDDPKVVQQGLKCLDTLLALDHAQVLGYILKPTHTPRVVECPLIPRLLDLFSVEDNRLLRGATRVSLSLLSVPSGWRLARLFSSYITYPVLETFMLVLRQNSSSSSSTTTAENTTKANPSTNFVNSPREVVEQDEVKSELLRILSRLCACPSGPVASAVASLSEVRDCIESLAFEQSLTRPSFWPAFAVLEYVCRFGAPSSQKRQEWIFRATEHVLKLARSLPPITPSASSSTPMHATSLQPIPEARSPPAATENLFFATNAALRLIQEAFAPLPPAEISPDLATAVITVLSSLPITKDAESLFAALENAPSPCTKARWDAVWRSTRSPNETVHALNARIACLQAGYPTKAVVDKLPILLNEVISKKFLSSVEQFPRSLGGGRFGARRICRGALKFIREASQRCIRSLDVNSIYHALAELDGARSLVRIGLRYGEEDSTLLVLFGQVFGELTKVTPSRAAKALIEASEANALVEMLLDVSPLDALRVFSAWTRTSGPAFDLLVPLQSMERVMNKVVQIMKRQSSLEETGQSDVENASRFFAKELCFVMGNICRKSNKYCDTLQEAFHILATDTKFQLKDEAMALAVGNAAFHPSSLHPTLALFVPTLVSMLSDSSADAKARGNAALALGNLLRHGEEEMDSMLAKSSACGDLINALKSADCSLLERRVMLLSLGTFASRSLCRAELTNEANRDVVMSLIESNLDHSDSEVKSAARRAQEKMKI